MPKIKLKLSTDSISQALKEVKAYRKKVQEAADELTKRLTEQGVSLAQLNASYMNIYDTGELMRGIESQYKGKMGFVVSTATLCIFCEFGTGIIGAQNSHPEVAIAGWKYDVNDHGELGWWYIGRDGKAHWTKGMPSRPFMYDTAKMLRNMVVPLAKGVMR